jgi:hypothetical protein
MHRAIVQGLNDANISIPVTDEQPLAPDVSCFQLLVPARGGKLVPKELADGSFTMKEILNHYKKRLPNMLLATDPRSSFPVIIVGMSMTIVGSIQFTDTLP